CILKSNGGGEKRFAAGGGQCDDEHREEEMTHGSKRNRVYCRSGARHFRHGAGVVTRSGAWDAGVRFKCRAAPRLLDRQGTARRLRGCVARGRVPPQVENGLPDPIRTQNPRDESVRLAAYVRRSGIVGTEGSRLLRLRRAEAFITRPRAMDRPARTVDGEAGCWPLVEGPVTRELLRP